MPTSTLQNIKSPLFQAHDLVSGEVHTFRFSVELSKSISPEITPHKFVVLQSDYLNSVCVNSSPVYVGGSLEGAEDYITTVSTQIALEGSADIIGD